jgi:hypothetical protein
MNAITHPTRLSELNDNDFTSVSEIVVGTAQEHITDWKLDEDTIDEDILPAKTKWDTTHAANSNRNTSNKITVAEKNAARERYQPVLRKFILALQNNKYVTDDDLIEMGIYIEPHSNQPLPATDEQVEIEVELDTIRRVIGNFKPKGATNKAKPHGVGSMELRHAVRDDDPDEVEDLTEVDLYTRSPFVLEFKESERGKKVYMVGRWIMKNGKPGPWGEITYSIIP